MNIEVKEIVTRCVLCKNESIHINISFCVPVMRYSLEEVFNSPLKKLAKFKSTKQTGSKFYCLTNNLTVLNDEETVIGLQYDNGETLLL